MHILFCAFGFTSAHTVQGEIFKETKERLSKRTGIKGKQFEKIKFAVVPKSLYSNPRYLDDGKSYIFPFKRRYRDANITTADDILSDIVGESDDMLGLDHVNKSRSFWSRSESFFIR